MGDIALRVIDFCRKERPDLDTATYGAIRMRYFDDHPDRKSAWWKNSTAPAAPWVTTAAELDNLKPYLHDAKIVSESIDRAKILQAMSAAATNARKKATDDIRIDIKSRFGNMKLSIEEVRETIPALMEEVQRLEDENEKLKALSRQRPKNINKSSEEFVKKVADIVVSNPDIMIARDRDAIQLIVKKLNDEGIMAPSGVPMQTHNLHHYKDRIKKAVTERVSSGAKPKIRVPVVTVSMAA